ncbi:hypothetical protein AS25_00100 [Kocuria marina]|uniref:Uncharacterized protein n=1 Tax=Kocuria marina TaxID=223184 RepID=A0A0B0DDX5_9MICC|nr:hypothetical protein AS25_00100 [Kocuria marina]
MLISCILPGLAPGRFEGNEKLSGQQVGFLLVVATQAALAVMSKRDPEGVLKEDVGHLVTQGGTSPLGCMAVVLENE